MKASVLLFKRRNKAAFSQQVKLVSQLLLLYIWKTKKQINKNISTEKKPPALPFNAAMIAK